MVGDGIDNDCDNEIDEEVKDGKDNDGDGKIDEDLELVMLILYSAYFWIIKECWMYTLMNSIALEFCLKVNAGECLISHPV